MYTSRGIVTLAFGPEVYKRQAMTLAESLMLHYPSTPRAVITDDPAFFPKSHFRTAIKIHPNYREGMLEKLRLPDYSPFCETLYIDTDCLVVRDLDFAWELLSQKSIGVVGENNRYDGNWLNADIADVRRALHIRDPLPVFNGGVLYFDESLAARAIFERATALVRLYGPLGFGNAGGKRWHVSDEPLFAIAMAEQGLRATDDGGYVMRTLIDLRGPLRVDVLAGTAKFSKGGVQVEPAIVHFAGQRTRNWYYRRESARLRHKDGRSCASRLIRSSEYRAATDLPLGVGAIAHQRARSLAKTLVRR